MRDLYMEPVRAGIDDVEFETPSGQGRARLYYPTLSATAWEAPVYDGDYPLVVFAHGDRSGEPGLCPPDESEDYTRWGHVFELFARCGFVVAVPDISSIVFSTEGTAQAIEDMVEWMRAEWPNRAVLFTPAEFEDTSPLAAMRYGQQPAVAAGSEADEARRVPIIDPPVAGLDWPTPLGLVGHSWGARGRALAAVRGRVAVTALASLAGSWDDTSAIDALVAAAIPTVMMVGSEDFLNASSPGALWPNLSAPKHQAMFRDIGHWDWFGASGGIQPCDDDAERPRCLGGVSKAATAMTLGFMVKYLTGQWWRSPRLIDNPLGDRPGFLPAFHGESPCAVKVRWDDPTAPFMDPPQPAEGDMTFGSWPSEPDW